MFKEFVETPRLERVIGRTFKFLSPNTWTTLSLLISFLAFGAVYMQHIYIGLALFALSAFCDLIDGKVARHTNRSTTLGAFWDGVVDRFVDMLFILSFFYIDLPESAFPLSILLFLLLFTTLLPPFIVAYANHRGAVPDPTEKVIWRFAFRMEYVIPFVLILAINPISPKASYYLLWASLVLMTATTIQSIILTFIKSKQYS